MVRRPIDFLVQMHEHAIVKESNMRRLDYAVAIDERRREYHVVALPLSGRAANVHERWCLSIDRSALAVRRPLLVERVEDLNLVHSVNHHAVVATVFPRAHIIRRSPPFEMQLETSELLLGARRNISRRFEAAVH